MTRATIYPEADTRSAWFARSHPGDVMPHPNVVVLHTTEGSSWPSYSGGAVAPTLTYFPGHGWRQHFPLNMSARALQNHRGGVETNTLNVIQIELVGTCTKGGPGLFWPAADDSDLAPLAAFLRWVSGEWPIPLVSTPRPWLPYPRSYGASPARMTAQEWLNFSGVCGHQHVPENDHGDPGAFPIGRLLELAKPQQTVPLGGGRGMSAPIHVPAPAPAPKPARYFVTHVLYARRGTPDHGAAAWYLDAAGRDDVALVVTADAAKAAHAAGAHVIAVGGPACADVASLSGVTPVNGSDAIATGRQLAGLTL